MAMFLRSIPRTITAASRGSAIPTAAIRRAGPSSSSSSRLGSICRQQQQQTRALSSSSPVASAASSEHAISNPTLAGIEKRWETMPPQEQAELWMQLRDRMKVDWHHLTLQEKKAAYWIAFGPHGPRAETPKGEGWRVFFKTMQLFLAAVAIVYVSRLFAKPPPRTLTKEWQEASNEYAKREGIEPLQGPSSEGYKGKGYVQSPSEADQ